MRTLTGLIFALLLVIPLSSRAQSAPQALLAFRTTSVKDWVFRSDENSLMDHDKTLRLNGTVVAVRFCSAAPLKTSLKLQRYQIASIMNFLKQVYSYSADRFLILQQTNCGGGRDAAIELWVIPEQAEIPSATGMANGCHLPEVVGLRRKLGRVSH
jgi:hypothetical protein